MESGGPRRPAPPPPATNSSSSVKQNGTVTFRTQSGTKVASGKETVVVVQRKGSNTKRMPLFRKITRDKGRNGNSLGSGDGQVVNSASAAATSRETTNRNRNSEGNQNNKKRSVFFKLTDSKSNSQSSRPMIIRPGAVQVRKKAPPPRPPPPKINKSVAPTSFPPSYDEVLRADVDEFIGQMNGQTKPPPPLSKPLSGSLSSRTVSMPILAPPSRPTTRPRPQRNVDINNLLIDFDAPSPPTNSSSHNQVQKKQVQSLLDMDNLFGSDPFSPAPTHQSNLAAKYNLGPRVLPPNHVVPSNDNFLRSSSVSNNVSNDHWSDGTAVRRGSVPVGASLGDNWLQSCLKDTSCSNFQFSTSPPPALPPRPKAEDSFIDDRDSDNSPSSPLPPSMTPPPVPPLPTADVDSYVQDLETTPPLPPRPKSYDATKPRAIALYDYNAIQNDDLSFKAGDVITLIQEVSEDWLYGSNGQREGLFPKNFVNIIVPFSDYSEDEYVNEDFRGPRCRAIYDFVGENDNELSFVTGDVISLEERVGDDWFRGTLRGNEGLLPVTFVDVIEELPFEDSFISNMNGQVCVATYDFVGESGELTFREGDRILTTGEINNEWLLGKLVGNDREGRFPKNFVQRL